MSPTKSEIQAHIEKLKKQVKRAEEKGFLDTAHHQMLRRYQEMLKEIAGGVSPRNAGRDKEN